MAETAFQRVSRVRVFGPFGWIVPAAAALLACAGCSMLYPFDLPEAGDAADAEDGVEADDAPDVEGDGSEVEGDGGAVCGDGVVDPPEACDTALAVACTTTCGTGGTRACLACAELASDCTPPAEVCNGTDDDCDGETDEGFACAAGAVSACTTPCGTAGTVICTASCTLPAGCAPPAETCNGIDDDCDTTVDEGCACAAGWVAENPLAYGFESILRIATTPDGHAFAVGSAGRIIRFDGEAWHRVEHDAGTYNLKAVHALSRDFAVAVGSAGATVFWDGTEWTYVASGVTQNLIGVFAVAENDVWAVGSIGTIVRWNGTAWNPVTSGTVRHLYDVWASGPEDVYAVGPGPTILRYDGSSWRAVTPAWATSELERVWGTGPDDVFVVASHGAILHWDGSRWSPMDSGITETLYGIWGSSPTDVWAAGGWTGGTIIHYDGTGWTSVPFPPVDPDGLTDVGGFASDDVWVVARSGGLLHWDGTAWMPAPGGVTVSLRGLGGAGPGRVWAVGDGAAVIERAADRWELPHWVDGFPARAMWAGGPDDLVLVGDAVTVRRWDGSAWRDVPTGLSQIGLTDVWGASADALFAVGRFTYAEGPAIAMSFNGTRWTTVPVPSLPDILLRSVHGDGAGTVMAVGDRGVILRRNSAAGFTTLVAPAPVPEPPDPPPPDLHAVWVYSATVAFAVGTADTILRWDGSAWTPMASPTTDVDLFAVWGAAPDDVFAAGRYATLLHWDGSSWQYEAHEAMADLIDIWGSGPNDIYVAGDNLTGTILHRCGTR